MPLLVLACSAVWHLEDRQTRQRPLLAAALQSQRTLHVLEQQARTLLTHDPFAAAPARPLAASLADVLDLLQAGDARQGVRAGLLSLPGRMGGVIDGPPDAQDLRAMSRDVPGVPGLRSVRLDVRASYRSYAGLRAWCAALEALPLIVQHVVLEDTQVQLDLLVLGR